MHRTNLTNKILIFAMLISPGFRRNNWIKNNRIHIESRHFMYKFQYKYVIYYISEIFHHRRGKIKILNLKAKKIKIVAYHILVFPVETDVQYYCIISHSVFHGVNNIQKYKKNKHFVLN